MPPSNLPPNSSPSAGFDLNHPTIISLLYLGGFVTGISGFAGLVLAFVWKGEAHDGWEDSHYQYLINTFWIGLAGSIIGFILTIVLIGIFILMAVAAWVIVRSVLSLINAQKRIPMPNPGSWTI
ncbi:MAG: hypothetical protein ABL882_03050 [Sphingopyxis sp.]